MTSSSNTAAALSKLMAAKGYASQNALASATGSSQAYLNQVMRGERSPSSQWLNTIALGLGLNAKERWALHRACARDHGFEIDLCETRKSR